MSLGESLFDWARVPWDQALAAVLQAKGLDHKSLATSFE